MPHCRTCAQRFARTWPGLQGEFKWWRDHHRVPAR